MGYVDSAEAVPRSRVLIDIRGKDAPAIIVALPFVPHRYYRKPGPEKKEIG